MAGSKILGFDLCPRIYGMADRKLHVLRGMKVPESIAAEPTTGEGRGPPAAPVEPRCGGTPGRR